MRRLHLFCICFHRNTSATFARAFTLEPNLRVAWYEQMRAGKKSWTYNKKWPIQFKVRSAFAGSGGVVTLDVYSVLVRTLRKLAAFITGDRVALYIWCAFDVLTSELLLAQTR